MCGGGGEGVEGLNWYGFVQGLVGVHMLHVYLGAFICFCKVGSLM